MTPEISTIEDLALQLTGQTEIQMTKNWAHTPDDWACPCCKRTKLHIARPLERNILKCSLIDHHDHIADYADKKLTSLVKQTGRKNVSEREGWFKNQKIKPLIVRFLPTLVCEDCNNADPAAKAIISGICPYFSFSPENITYFIKPQKHTPHRIDHKRAAEVYERESQNYDFQKSICDTLLSRLVSHSRHWGDEVQYPNSSHYRIARKIVNGRGIPSQDLSGIKAIQPSLGGQFISKAIQLLEIEAHDKASKPLSVKEEKLARRHRLKLEQQKKKKDEGFFNFNEKWSQSDVAELKLDYEKHPNIEPLSKKYGRTPGSIKAKLKSLGFETP